MAEQPDEALEVTSTGFTHHVGPERLEQAESKMTDAIRYHVKAKTHLWTVFLIHQATDVLLDRISGEESEIPMLDVDTLLSRPMLGCYICEVEFSSRERHRRCPGLT